MYVCSIVDPTMHRGRRRRPGLPPSCQRTVTVALPLRSDSITAVSSTRAMTLAASKSHELVSWRITFCISEFYNVDVLFM